VDQKGRSDTHGASDLGRSYAARAAAAVRPGASVGRAANGNNKPKPAESAAAASTLSTASRPTTKRRRITQDLWKTGGRAEGNPATPRSRNLKGTSLRAVAQRSAAPTAVCETAERTLYEDAMAVRRAVLSDLRSPQTVQAFARDRLMIKGVTPHVVDAIVDVLLADDWVAMTVPEDQLLRHFRARTSERHRLHRPLLESRLGTTRVASLSERAGVGQLGDLVSDYRETDTEALAVGLWEDRRLRLVMAQLDAESRRLVEAVAKYPRTSWNDAAVLTGAREQRSEQVRRRLRYLAREYIRRDGMRPKRLDSKEGR
jgi:hypothetical protein